MLYCLFVCIVLFGSGFDSPVGGLVCVVFVCDGGFGFGMFGCLFADCVLDMVINSVVYAI